MMTLTTKEMTLWRQNALSVNTWKTLLAEPKIMWKSLSKDDLFYWSNAGV